MKEALLCEEEAIRDESGNSGWRNMYLEKSCEAIVWGEFKNGNYTPMYGLGIALAGFPVYQIWKRVWTRGFNETADLYRQGP